MFRWLWAAAVHACRPVCPTGADPGRVAIIGSGWYSGKTSKSRNSWNGRMGRENVALSKARDPYHILTGQLRRTIAVSDRLEERSKYEDKQDCLSGCRHR